jgi:hypothetical protein
MLKNLFKNIITFAEVFTKVLLRIFLFKMIFCQPVH